MKYSAYPVYKDSGVEWLGEIPEHWETKKVKHVSSVFVPQRNKPELNLDSGLPWITMEDITSPSVDSSLIGYYVSELDALTAGSRALPPGCVIASCVGNFGVASVNKVSVIINQQLQAYIPKKIDSWFLRYLVEISKPYFEKVATATTLVYVNQERFGELPIVSPLIAEQKAIASFLDRETAKIDALIAKKERLIELLQEKRTAIINHAVTKGLDPTAPLKDSGVECLGEIPAHWEAKRLRFTIRNGTQNGLYKSKDYYDDKGTPIISMSEAFASSVTRVLAKNRVQLTDDEYRSYSLEKGDLLFARRSLVFEGSGKCSMVGELPEVHIFESSIIRVSPDITVVEPLFALLSLNSVPGRFQILRITKQVTISGIDAPNLKDVVIPLPPPDEQLAIISFINRETVKIDALIGKIREGIEKLKEYRAALISAAVTGKIDVRELTD